MSGVLGTNVVTQIAIVVKDIEATKKKYAEFFGVDVPGHFDSGPHDENSDAVTLYKGAPNYRAGAKLAFINIGPNVALELIEPIGGASVWKDVLDEKGEGFHHIAFVVKDIDESITACENFGMPLVQRSVSPPGSGNYAYLDGTKDLKCIIELLCGY